MYASSNMCRGFRQWKFSIHDDIRKITTFSSKWDNMCGGSGGGLAVTTFSFFYSPFSLSLPCKTCCPIRKSIFSSYFVMVFDITLLFSIVSFLSWFFYKLYFFLIHHWLKCYFSSYFVLVSCLILSFFWVFFLFLLSSVWFFQYYPLIN